MTRSSKYILTNSTLNEVKCILKCTVFKNYICKTKQELRQHRNDYKHFKEI